MLEYWKRKIAEKLRHRTPMVRGVGCTRYTFEVLNVDEELNAVLLECRSVRIVPSGYVAGGSDRYHGEVWCAIGKSKAETIEEALNYCE